MYWSEEDDDVVKGKMAPQEWHVRALCSLLFFNYHYFHHKKITDHINMNNLGKQLFSHLLYYSFQTL